MVSTDVDLGSHWHDLFGAALLGTDRRLPPAAPPGPVAELLVELPPADAAAELLEQIGATAALRRAGAAPLAPVPALQSPAPDPRPEIPAAAAARLDHILDSWPVVEHEWLLAVLAGGWRLDPASTVRLLRRHRTDAVLLPIVLDATGPLGPWLADQVPSLAPPKRTVARDVSPEPSLAGVPAELIAVAGATPGEIAAAVRARVQIHGRSPAERAPLIAFIAHVAPQALPEIGEALGAFHGDAAATMLAAHLADLATTRLLMLHDLRPDPTGTTDDR